MNSENNNKPFDPLAPQNVGLDNVKKVENNTDNSFVTNHNNTNANSANNTFIPNETSTPTFLNKVDEPIKVSPIGNDNHEKLAKEASLNGPYIPKDKIKDNSGKGGVIVAFVLIIGMIITIQLWPQLTRGELYKEKKTLEEKEEAIKNFKSLTTATSSDFAGLYENDNSIIKIYNDSDNSVWFYFKSKTNKKVISAPARVVKGELYFDSTVKIKANVSENKDSILIDFNETPTRKDLLTRKQNYVFDEYFNDFYIDSEEYLNTRYNGCFTNDEIILCMYQPDENFVRVDVRGITKFSMDYKINGDGTLKDKGYKISFVADNRISFEKDNEVKELTFTNKLTKKQIAETFSHYYD